MPRYGPGQTVTPSKPPPKRQAPPPSPEDLRPSQPSRSGPPAPRRRQRAQPLAPSPEDIRQPKPQFDQPNAPKPTGPPIPVLQNLGFHGSIFDFNQRVDHVTQRYQERFGTRPTPGLAFDLARSMVADIGHLFDATPASDRVARLKPVADAAPKTFFLTKDPQTGALVEQSPLLRRIVDAAAHVQLTPKQQAREAREQFPTSVQAQQMGLLPLTSVSQPRLEEALGRFDKFVGEGTLKITQGGIDISQYEKELKAAGSGATRVLPTGEVVPDIAARRIAEANVKGSKGAPIVNTIRTIKQAQTELNDRMGTKLPVSGIFNDDWLKAVSNWMHSASYFQQVAKYQSQAAGFGDDYNSFRKAWQFKQGAAKKHAWAQWFIAAQPLHLFAHGGGVHGFAHGVFDDLIEPKTLGFSTPLHALTHTAGLGLSEVGGSLNQGKSYISVGNALTQAVVAHGFTGKTLEESRAAIRKSLVANPSWLRVIYPQLPEHPTGKLAALDKLTNLAGDLLLLRKPAFTGERVAAGDILGARRSAYLRSASHWAFEDLKRGNIGRAASTLEGGRGAEALVSRAFPLIRAGRLSEEGFGQHLAELYAKGRTVINERAVATTLREQGRTPEQVKELLGNAGGIEVTGPVLSSLRTRALPTPGVPGRALIRSKSALRDFSDSFDKSLRRSQVPGTDNAANFFSNLRAEFAHAAPRTTRSYSDPRLPERVHDFTIKHFGDAELANKWESHLVRFRSRDNYPGIQQLERKIQRRYAEKYPEGRDYATEDPFKPTVSTEAPSVFHFPSGGQKEVTGPLTALSNWARSVDGLFNRLAVAHSRIILSGFPIPGGGLSLAWKHVVGDTIRRGIGEDGFLFGTGAKMKSAQREIDAVAAQDPAVSRALGTYVSRATQGETRWLLNRGASVQPKSFQAGEKFGRGNYMKAAGGYLRRMLDDPAITAYRNSAEDDLGPLVNLILHDRTYRGLWKSAQRASKVAVDDPGISAEDFAQKIWNRYVEVEDAAKAAGSADPFEEATKVLQANRGANVDKALGDFIAENRWDFPVRKAQVEQIGSFDQLTGWWIGKIMTANKWNRGQMAKRTMYRVYSELKGAGWDEKAALSTAMDVGERATVYHMLDFANRLQVEQDLRWLSYFATKHRLYWKWVIGTLVRRPGAALAISDIRQHLDGRGNLNFSLFGQKLAIPAARLVWVPGQEYSEVSPVALGLYGLATGGPQGAVNAAKGTFGNIFTRSDTALQLLGRVAGMQAGKIPTTYTDALKGLDDQTKSRVARAINEYQTGYFEAHGHYAAEADVVKHVLWVQSAEETWRANLPLPVLWGGLVPKENTGQKLLRKFMQLNDPAKRRRFLDENPALALYFGVYTDPATYLHNREFWRSYNTSRDQFRNARQQVYEQAKQDGFTPKLREQIRKINAAFGGDFNKLLLRDAAENGKLTEEGRALLASGKDLSEIAPEQYIQKKGTWGTQILVDPLVDPKAAVHGMFPNLKPGELEHGVPGFAVKQARAELKLLRDPSFQQTFDAAGEEAQSEIKTRIRELLQFVSDFQSFPADALGKVQRDYQAKHVNPYWTEVEKRYQHIKSLPRDQQDLAYANFRQWRDSQDGAVTVDGVRFPSPVRMAWAMLDPQTRKERLAKLAGADWAHVTAYEKQLLGKKVDEKTSTGWAALSFYKAALLGHIQVAGFKPLPQGQRTISAAYERNLAKYVEKVGDGGKPVPGFYRDYLFSKEPTYQRMQVLGPIKESPHRANWTEVFTVAKGYSQYLKSPDYSKSAVRDSWRDYVDTSVVPYLRDHPRFAREVALYRTSQGPTSPTRRDVISMATDVVYGLIHN